MTRAELARMLDHSVLKPESTLADVHAGIDVVPVRDLSRALALGLVTGLRVLA